MPVSIDTICSLRYSDNVWFTDYRPDKIFIECSLNFSKIEVLDNQGNLILNETGSFVLNTPYSFDLVFLGVADGGGQYDIDRIKIYSHESGYLKYIKFGPQQPTEHAM